MIIETGKWWIRHTLHDRIRKAVGGEMEGRVVDEEKPNKDASHRSLRISSGTRNGNVYRMLDRLKDERFVQIHWEGAVTI